MYCFLSDLLVAGLAVSAAELDECFRPEIGRMFPTTSKVGRLFPIALQSLADFLRFPLFQSGSFLHFWADGLHSLQS